jgi:uncharacterized membrane protein YecN with MAPEG domain
MTPHITAMYGSLLALWLLILAYRVVLLRKKHKVGVGTGGHADLDVAMRCHGNACEYVPMAVILLLLAELQNAPIIILHVAGIVFLIGRFLHSQGLTKTQGGISFGRFWGTLATWLTLVVLAGVNLLLALL